MNKVKHRTKSSGTAILIAALMSMAAFPKEDITPLSDDQGTWIRWEPGSTTFVIGQRGPSITIGGEVFEDDVELLRNLAFLWNHVAANVQYDIVEGCVDGDGFPCLPVGDPRNNGKNEIHFKSPILSGVEDSLGLVDLRFLPRQPCDVLPSGICVEGRIVEADIFLNRLEAFFTWRDQGACERGSFRDYVETVLLHEMGHALGLRHINEAGPHIMYPSQSGCHAFPAPGRRDGLSFQDKKQLRDLYGPFDSVNVAITHPPHGNFPVFPGNDLFVEAEFQTLFAADTVQAASVAGINWRASDKLLASGTTATIPVDELFPGQHEIIAEAVDSAGNRLGSAAVTVNKITDLVTDEQFIVFPIPCIELAGEPANRCMIRLVQNWLTHDCPAGFFEHQISAEDLLTGTQFSVSNPSFDLSPWGTGCTDDTVFPLYFGIWGETPSDRFQLRFVHNVFQNGVFRSGSRVSGLVYKTAPVLDRFTVPGTCPLGVGETTCAATIDWEGLYFAPSSADYYRTAPGNAWIKLGDMSVTSGSLESAPVVTESGIEIAAFQYGSDFRVPSSDMHSFTGYRTLIAAPAGLLAGPFLVQAEDDLLFRDGFEPEQ